MTLRLGSFRTDAVTPWSNTQAYVPGNVVWYNGVSITPNALVPAGTAVVIGTTGATWSLVDNPTLQGQMLFNFGAALTDTATQAVTGVTLIQAGMSIVVQVNPTTTVDHTADEHWVEDVEFFAGNILAGTGFTIYGKCRAGLTYGNFNLQWQAN